MHRHWNLKFFLYGWCLLCATTLAPNTIETNKVLLLSVANKALQRMLKTFLSVWCIFWLRYVFMANLDMLKNRYQFFWDSGESKSGTNWSSNSLVVVVEVDVAAHSQRAKSVSELFSLMSTMCRRPTAKVWRTSIFPSPSTARKFGGLVVLWRHGYGWHWPNKPCCLQSPHRKLEDFS